MTVIATPFAFFGTSRFSVIILDDIKSVGIIPELIITAPDRPVGRKQVMTPPPVKEWAVQNGVKILQPESLRDAMVLSSLLGDLKPYDFYIVASYGKIIPKEILDLPRLGILNVHPSLLPKYRGASPIQNQILNNEEHVGVTIMHMDEEMDHGPIVAQKEVEFEPGTFPGSYEVTEEKLAHESAALLIESLQKWIESADANAKQTAQSDQNQDHAAATYTKIIQKADGEIDLTDEAHKNYQKYLAYGHWPKTFFYFEKDGKKQRAVITEAALREGKFRILKVIPEGKKEMSYEDFLSWMR